MIDPASYIRRETGVSAVINTALSLGFFLGVFGWGKPVPVWGMGHYVFDFIPQAFMIALMTTLVPGALAGKALRAGKVAPWLAGSRLPRALWQRALLLAIVSAVVTVAVAATVLAVIGLPVLPPYPALTAKLALGMALAVLITPPSLRAALSQPA